MTTLMAKVLQILSIKLEIYNRLIELSNDNFNIFGYPNVFSAVF
jgi:hypothetical protein